MTKLNNKTMTNLITGLQSQFPESAVGYDMKIHHQNVGMIDGRFPTFKIYKRHIITIDELISETNENHYLPLQEV